MTYNGTWKGSMKTPMGVQHSEITLEQDGNDLSGSMTSNGFTADILKGRVSNGRAKWEVKVTSPARMTLSFDVAEDGGNLDGKVKLGMYGRSTVHATPV